MSKFDTENFENLVAIIKPLLDENYQVLIISDCEGVYSVDWCKPEYGDGEYRVFTEEYRDGVCEFRLDGELVEFPVEEE